MHNEDYTNKILVFDSGAGGISVLRELVKLMPNEDFIYYGDSKNAPYGTKSKEEVRKLTFEVVEDYIEKGIKGVCVACNTATSAAVASLRERYPNLPIVGIEPAIKPAAKAFPGGRIVVLATPMTVALPKFNGLFDKYKTEAKIIPVAAPGLMEFVERGETDGERIEKFLEELLADYKNKCDAVVTGCTHYIFASEAIIRVLGDVKLFDGGFGTARYMKQILDDKGVLTASKEPGNIEFICSSDDKSHIEIFKTLLGKKVP